MSDNLLDTKFVGDEFIAKIRAAYNAAGLTAHGNAPGFWSRLFNSAAEKIPGSAFTIKYLSDNGGLDHDLAKAEIEGRFNDFSAIISALSKQSVPNIQYNDTPPQDSIGGAYDFAQITRDSVRGVGNVVFLNCAPRKKETGKHDNNKGENVYVGMLENGTVIAATGEESFTFFHDLIARGELELYRANVQTAGSQFRSRDYWPLYTLVLTHQLRALAEKGEWKAGLSVEARHAFLTRLNVIDTNYAVPAESIPNPAQRPAIVRYDTHGNLKLNVRAADLPENLKDKILQIEINDYAFKTLLGKSMFQKQRGSFSFSEGSTGKWADYKRLKKEFGEVSNDNGLRWEADKAGFLQIVLIGGSAMDYFKITDEMLRSDKGVPVDIIPARNTLVLIDPSSDTELKFPESKL